MTFEVPFLPKLGLQLAIRLETCRMALRAIVADGSDKTQVESASAAFSSVRELASQLPGLWVDWGSVAVAFSQFHEARLACRRRGELHKRLFDVEQRAEVLAQRAIRWALFEQRHANLPMAVADAFIDWDSARKVLHEQRQAVSRQHFDHRERPAASVPAELREVHDRCEIHSAALLLKAVASLDSPLGLDRRDHGA